MNSPFDLRSNEAEMGVLGSMMLSDRATEQVIDMLAVEDFVNPAHRVLYSSLKKIHASGRPMDLLVITDELRATDALTEIGGDDYLIQVAEFTPSPANSGYYAGIVSDLSARRRRESAARKIIEKCYDREVAISQIDAAFERATESKPKTEEGGLMTLGEVQDVAARGVATGFGRQFDCITGVGWPSRQVSIVSAGIGTGKTNFMLQSAYDCAKRGLRTAYMLAADLSPAELRERLYKHETGWKTTPTHSVELAAEWAESAEKINKLKKLCIYDWNKHGSEWETMAAMLRGAHAKEAFDVVFVDYLQELETTRRDLRALEQAAYLMKSLCKMAARLDCPVVAGSQITKMDDGTFMTKGARAYEEKAALVLRLEKEDGDGAELPASVFIRKNRMGPQGMTFNARFTARNLRWDVLDTKPKETSAATKREAKEKPYDPWRDE